MKETSETKGIVLMLISIVLFTVNTLGVRAIAINFPVCDGWQVTLFRGLAGSLVVLALYSHGRGLRLKSLLDRPRVIARGVIGGIGIYFYYLTVIEIGAARAVVINLTYPIFATVLAAVFLKERLSLKKLLWIATGFTGLLIFLGPKALDEGFSKYDGFAILGALLAAGVVVLIRDLHRTEHGSTIFASQAMYGFLISAPIAIPQTSTVPVIGMFGLIIAGIIVAFGQLTMTFAYRHLEVSKGSPMQMLLPIATAIGSWFLFGERFGAIEFLGAALTLMATVMVNRQTSKSPAPVASPQTTNS